MNVLLSRSIDYDEYGGRIGRFETSTNIRFNRNADTHVRKPINATWCLMFFIFFEAQMTKSMKIFITDYLVLQVF